MGYRPLFSGLGVVAAYLAALLGLSFYARRRIGERLWRKAHRATVLVYLLGVVHALGAGTDASTPWLRTFLLITGAPIVVLFLRRLRGRRPVRETRPVAGGSGGMGAGVVIVGAGLAGQRCWRGAARARVTCSAHGDCAAVAPRDLPRGRHRHRHR